MRLPVNLFSIKKDFIGVWLQVQTLCSPGWIGLDSTNIHSFWKSSSSLRCCRWSCKLSSCSRQIPPWTHLMCRYLLIFHVNVTLQYQQSKQGFWNARTFLTWSLKFLALVNSVPQIVHEKLSGLFECCCRTWYCIVSFLPKVKGHCRHVERNSSV